MASTIEIKTDKGGIDLLDGAEDIFYITRQINDLQNLQSRQADFTRTINIPATPNNLTIINAHEVASGASNNVGTKIPARILMDGIQVAPLATLLHVKTNFKDDVITLEIALLYGNFNLFDALPQGSIQDLNWADLALDWTPENVAALGNKTTDMVLGWTDWHDSSFTPEGSSSMIDQDINISGFWMYVTEIMNRIVSEAGFRLEVLSAPDDYFIAAINAPIGKFVQQQEAEGVSVFTDANNPVDFVNFGAGEVTIPFTTVVTETNAGSWSGGVFTPNQAFAGTMTITGKVTVNQNNPNNIPPEIRLMKNGNVEDSIAFPNNETETQFFIDVDISVVNLDQLYGATWTDQTRPQDQRDTITIEELSVITIKTDDVVTREIQPSNWLPPISNESFFVSILSHFNLQILTDDISKTVTMAKFDDIFTKTPQDWTEFFDSGEEVQVDHSLDGWGQQSLFSYLTVENLSIQPNYIKSFNNQVLALEAQIIDLPYGASNSAFYKRPTQPDFVAIPVFGVESEYVFEPGVDAISVDGINFELLGDSPASFEVGDYILVATTDVNLYANEGNRRIVSKTSDVTGTVNITFTNQPLTTEAYSIVRHSFDRNSPRIALMVDNTDTIDNYVFDAGTLGGASDFGTLVAEPVKYAQFSPSLFWEDIVENTHYRRLVNALETPQLLQAWFNIPTAVFEAIDMDVAVWLDQFNAYYYINKIDQFKGDSKTRIDLIRINTYG